MITKLASLRQVVDLSGLAHLLGYTPKTLAYILYRIPPAARYKTFDVAKKSGGPRLISAPCEHLMQLQRALAALLYDCYDDIVKDVRVSEAVSHGFRRELSILTNAAQHRARRNVLNVDLRDFFGSLNFGRVRGFFINSSDFKLHEPVATVIAQIACHNNCLPTGSPCSPVISNLIGRVLDLRLVRHAKRLGCTYTRYVDDLTFSSNHKSLPNALVKRAGADHVWQPGKLLTKEIDRAGFSINDKKTRVQYRDSRQEVTGLSVNRRVNTTAAYRRYTRAMLDSLFKSGAYCQPGTKGAAAPVPGTVAQLRGMFGFINYVDQKVLRAQVKIGEKVSPDSRLKRTLAYRRLVFFDDFYLSAAPVILVEGKTDRIHLRSALQRRPQVVPTLANATKSGTVQLSVRLYGGGSLATRFFGLDGGTPGLASFIKEYGDLRQGYGVAASSNPTIAVIDFDECVGEIKGALKKYGVILDGTKPFQWICHDLYVVCIPKKDSMIEELYDQKILDTKLGGKTFNMTNKAVGPNEYGKSHFANHVIRPNYKNIDFSGFDQLLKNIAAAVLAHAIQ
jgi:RNA-directed DNA polymerase